MAAARALLVARDLEKVGSVDMKNVAAVAILTHMTQGNELFALDFYLKFREDWMNDMSETKHVTYAQLVEWTGMVVAL